LIELKKAANVLKESLNEDEGQPAKPWEKNLPQGFSRPEELAAEALKQQQARPEADVPGQAATETLADAAPAPEKADAAKPAPAAETSDEQTAALDRKGAEAGKSDG
jgi:hypothetical protein